MEHCLIFSRGIFYVTIVLFLNILWLKAHTHTNTHPFNGLFSRTTWVSLYEKGKTNLDLTEATDSEWQWHQLGHMQVCTSLQQTTTPAPHHSVFYGPDALPTTQPTASKHWRHWKQSMKLLLGKHELAYVNVTVIKVCSIEYLTTNRINDSSF